ncbi:hypothetical protein ACIROD_07455 [Peribacillus sp. NPDC101481]|uniref:hypothetical protein n=1 Tax=Bacillaceae TaxID=186817 RepID=UPI000C3227FB|nr:MULTISPECIES: hypothetical protein [Bacillaceae]MCT4478899.1 hypothetical protein [Peribacillus frigoritolerans]PKF89453.1 hypothetical protein CW306_09075 [Bacillus sp. BA3]CAH0196945.1 hypothetical protein SRABI134_01890 [Peribacillus sp. Bi134]
MKRFFKFITDFNERKALERETDEFFRKEYENYMKMNPDNQGKRRRLTPRFYVIDGGKKGSNLEISDRKKSS